MLEYSWLFVYLFMKCYRHPLWWNCFGLWHCWHIIRSISNQAEISNYELKLWAALGQNDIETIHMFDVHSTLTFCLIINSYRFSAYCSFLREKKLNLSFSSDTSINCHHKSNDTQFITIYENIPDAYSKQHQQWRE